MALAAALYFATDFLLSALSVAVETRTALSGYLLQRGTLLAIACFVPFDSLGYLAAVVVQATAAVDASCCWRCRWSPCWSRPGPSPAAARTPAG